MHINTIEEARTIAELYKAHEGVLVLFCYPEHASSSVGVADIQLLEAMVKGTPVDQFVVDAQMDPEVIKEVQQLEKELAIVLNDRLAKAGLKERVKTEDTEEWISASVWFYEDDASTERVVWLLEKLRRNDIYVFYVNYGSKLHDKWLEWIGD